MNTSQNNPQGEYFIWFNCESEVVECGTYDEFQLKRLISSEPDNFKLVCKTETKQVASCAFEEIAKDLNKHIRLFSA